MRDEELHRLLYEVLKQRIAQRAYQLYLERGGAPGNDLDDWLQAELDVLGQSLAVPLYSRRSRVARVVARR